MNTKKIKPLTLELTKGVKPPNDLSALSPQFTNKMASRHKVSQRIGENDSNKPSTCQLISHNKISEHRRTPKTGEPAVWSGISITVFGQAMVCEKRILTSPYL